jgi:hypothetical protein
MAVGRFQVMALLQAARAYTLGLPLESAHSWGLNKAIFYAAAKLGFIASGGKRDGGKPKATKSVPSPKLEEITESEYKLGDDFAFIDTKMGTKNKPIFAFGGELQTDEKFKKQIEARFKGSFANAWKESLEYVKSFDKEILRSGNRFFSEVYRPKRDEFSKKWTEMSNRE